MCLCCGRSPDLGRQDVFFLICLTSVVSASRAWYAALFCAPDVILKLSKIKGCPFLSLSWTCRHFSFHRSQRNILSAAENTYPIHLRDKNMLFSPLDSAAWAKNYICLRKLLISLIQFVCWQENTKINGQICIEFASEIFPKLEALDRYTYISLYSFI